MIACRCCCALLSCFVFVFCCYGCVVRFISLCVGFVVALRFRGALLLCCMLCLRCVVLLLWYGLVAVVLWCIACFAFVS